MKTNFWYKDNWSGDFKEFYTLSKAKESAEKEDGISIIIYKRNGDIAEIVRANGFTYP